MATARRVGQELCQPGGGRRAERKDSESRAKKTGSNPLHVFVKDSKPLTQHISVQWLKAALHSNYVKAAISCCTNNKPINKHRVLIPM